MKTVSVHIVTYNCSKDIRDCLKAVFQQSYPINKVIVIDNASHDETSTILQTYGKQIELILNELNVGFAPAHNQAMKRSTCDYFLVLNPDVILHPDYVSELMNFAEANPNAGSLTGKLVWKQDPGLVDSTGLIINKARRAFDRGRGQAEQNWNKTEKVFGVSGAAPLYCKQMVTDVSVEGQFFDETFFAYKEDVDVAWRAQLLGWDSYYVPSAMAQHERGWKANSRSQQPLFVRKHSYINRYKMMIKNDSIKHLILHSPFIIPFELLSILFILLKEPKLITSWGSLFKEYPQLVRKRKFIQKKRNRPFRDIYSYFN